MSKSNNLYKCSLSGGTTLFFANLKSAMAWIEASSIALQTKPENFSVTLECVDARRQVFDGLPYPVSRRCNYSFSEWVKQTAN